jgi:CHASE3 domain sensor protein
MTPERARLLQFLEGVRTYLMVGRLAYVDELSDANDRTLDNVEQILESLETELEDETIRRE